MIQQEEAPRTGHSMSWGTEKQNHGEHWSLRQRCPWVQDCILDGQMNLILYTFIDNCVTYSLRMDRIVPFLPIWNNSFPKWPWPWHNIDVRNQKFRQRDHSRSYWYFYIRIYTAIFFAHICWERHQINNTRCPLCFTIGKIKPVIIQNWMEVKAFSSQQQKCLSLR